MGVTFDGTAKIITCTPGTLSLDIPVVYSRWKDWVLTADNSKFLAAFSVVGGEPVAAGISITPYFFLENGWRIRPQEADHELNVTGIVVVAGGGNPFIQTLGSFQVQIRSYLPIKTETAGGLNPDDIVLAMMDTVVADGKTMRKLLRLLGANLGGKLIRTAGGDPTTYHWWAIDDSKPRIEGEATATGRTITHLDDE